MKSSFTLWFGTALSLLAASGCRCTPSLEQLAPAQLVVTPQTLALGQVYVGQTGSGVVSAVNEGGVAAEADISVDAPFTVDSSHLHLLRGDSAALVVTFAPQQPGPVSGVLRVGTMAVPVTAEGLAVPACFPSNVCSEAHFDVGNAQCVEATRPDGSTCETSCVSGACSAGTCLGQLKGCDDGNACTIDACDESTGCSHSLRICPQPTAPCQVVKCDSATGCGSETAPDGTLCGPDDCLATQVDVCIAGQCVPRVRPDTGRCANRWMPTSITSRHDHAMAYDEARQRVVVFGGQHRYDTPNEADTWQWDGAKWMQRFPTTAPIERAFSAMAYDSARQRVVLFGGYGGNLLRADTWEWDGTTWVQRFPATSPPARGGHAMAYDAARQRVVLFGGNAGPTLSDTWEWDGTTWSQRPTPIFPPQRWSRPRLRCGAAAHRPLRGQQRVRHCLLGHLDLGWDDVDAAQPRPVACRPKGAGHGLRCRCAAGGALWGQG
jgi:hypothetical protein